MIDVKDWKLEIAGLVDRPTVFTMQDLHRLFKQREEQVTLQCAGNRRSGHAIYYPLSGDEIMTTQWYLRTSIDSGHLHLAFSLGLSNQSVMRCGVAFR